ncbi:ATPase, P-type (transporting), HAD superfamily, subfamily IC [Cryobacterium psychrotolerans]|uniref:ATPase, P-type (Transporting), HAD superfamily, subfamily IC n=1 Tax=Cryobacterium psychrotolerans TaxID=386301 RepID=A0A1G8XCF1_9MICO|nr:ATPase, P-type (transporting), HAD superfamily, subfamily IC [Cryobacterium psychrotolerans]
MTSKQIAASRTAAEPVPRHSLDPETAGHHAHPATVGGFGCHLPGPVHQRCPGFVQERKAEADVRALQSLSTPSCRVLRDGAERVVPGRDIVLFESGERVPADLRLIERNGLQDDESMRTGESFAATEHTDPLPREVVEADKANVAFIGTFVGSGRGRGVAIATGPDRSLGRDYLACLRQRAGADAPERPGMAPLHRRGLNGVDHCRGGKGRPALVPAAVTSSGSDVEPH